MVITAVDENNIGIRIGQILSSCKAGKPGAYNCNARTLVLL